MSRGRQRQSEQSTMSAPASGPAASGVEPELDLQSAGGGGNAAMQERMRQSAAEGDPEDAGAPAATPSVASIGDACSLSPGSGANLGTLSLGGVPVASARATDAMTEADGFWYTVQSGAAGRVQLVISASAIDVDIVRNQVDYQGVPVDVVFESGRGVPVASPAESAPAAAPAEASAAPAGGRNQDVPWYVLVPVVNLVGIWFWRPVREASAYAAEQSARTLDEHLVEIIGGIAIPIICGVEIALAPTGVVGAVQNKAECLQALSQAHSQQEQWAILNRYTAGAAARTFIGRLTAGLAGEAAPALQGTIQQWVARNAGWIARQMMATWANTASEAIVNRLMGGEFQTTDQFLDAVDTNTKKMLLAAVISRTLHLDVSAEHLGELVEILVDGAATAADAASPAEASAGS